MKVAMFCDDDIGRLIKNINEFIHDKKVIDIKYSSLYFPIELTFSGAIIKGQCNDRVLIMYEYTKKKQ